MNAIKFAELISYMTVVSGHRLDTDHIEGIEGRIKVLINPAGEANSVKVNLIPMFDFIAQGRKIDAIREHRALTGMGLKESKDEIERIMTK